ncbi:MAG: DUF4248 domain-containing protein [Bacteroidaceae bacterium]|nr:DUF4248 domain-containing protein [Bacteroidaceae bacterium]
MHIRPYYKGELAMLYAPNLTQQSATNRLNHWLRTNRELWGALQRSDYNTRQKLFTSYQVRLIVEFLGEP